MEAYIYGHPFNIAQRKGCTLYINKNHGDYKLHARVVSPSVSLFEDIASNKGRMFK